MPAATRWAIRNIDHVEFWVDDAEHWTNSYEKCYGMVRRAFGDTQSGVKGKRSFVVGQGRINFVFTQPDGDSPEAGVIRDHLEKHGCAVRDVAYRVNDPKQAINRAVKKRRTPARRLHRKRGLLPQRTQNLRRHRPLHARSYG